MKEVLKVFRVIFVAHNEAAKVEEPSKEPLDIPAPDGKIYWAYAHYACNAAMRASSSQNWRADRRLRHPVPSPKSGGRSEQWNSIDNGLELECISTEEARGRCCVGGTGAIKG